MSSSSFLKDPAFSPLFFSVGMTSGEMMMQQLNEGREKKELPNALASQAGMPVQDAKRQSESLHKVLICSD